MDTNTEHLHLVYGGMDTEELIDRTKSGTLTEDAHILALKELQSRGINTAELPENPFPSPPEKEIDPGFLWRCWHGKEELWKAFWLLSFLGGFVIFFITKIPSSRLIQAALFIFLVLPIQIFWWISVWRCAFHTSHWGWAILARVVVILGVYIAFSRLVTLRSLA